MSEISAPEPQARSSALVHIVTFNSREWISRCLESVLAQEGFETGQNLTVVVTDNASTDGTPDEVQARFGSRVTVIRNEANLGFCGGHNQGLSRFMSGTERWCLVLNPDLALAPTALAELVSASELHPRCGTACPRLLRSDEHLEALSTGTIDSTGIVMTPDIRHFDRGAGEPDGPAFAETRGVFGGSGACLLLSREFIEDVKLPTADLDNRALFSIYPQLAEGASERIQLFDEAFFAYREDADLAWRAQLLGWRCVYAPKAVGFHRRLVTPERRASLPAVINRLGVRNRFLLQANNLPIVGAPVPILVRGFVIRNIVVAAAAALVERSSFPGLVEFVRLLPRALRVRRIVLNRASDRRSPLRWFSSRPYTEPLPE